MTTKPQLSHAQANLIVDEIRKQLETHGEGAAVAVVDDHGELMAFLRTDGCRLPSINIAINKAYAAAREQIESAELGNRSRSGGWPMTNFGELRYPSWGGGIPVAIDGVTVGAIGVSGLPEARDIDLARLGAGLVG